MGKPIITLRGVSIEYRRDDRTPIKAISDINLELHPGEKIAVFGPNGSGKSTMLRVLAGLERPNRGEVSIFGSAAQREGLPPHLRQRLGFVFQNPEDVFAAGTVADEIKFVLECHQPGALVTGEDLHAVLAELGLGHLANRPLNRLSGGEKQKVALASVLTVRPEVIFFDEPTSYLDPPARREFLKHPIFTEEGHARTTVLVTQYWEEAKTCDRTLILKNGRVIYDDTPSGYTPAEQPRPSDFQNLDEVWLNAVTSPATDPLIVVEGLQQITPIFPGELVCPLQDISFSIRPGECVGLVGPTGAGKSTLAYHLAGLMPKFAGRIAISRRAVTGTTPKSSRPPVALLFQNPDHHLFAETVTQDVAFGPRNMGFPKDVIASHVERSLETAGLPAREFGPRSPFEISAGEQRKAALAGTLALPAAVYIFDEPTAYLDSESAARVEALILALSAAGKAVIVISHDLPFLRRVCPRWIILDKGRLIYNGSLAKLDKHPEPLQKIGFV